MSQHISPNTMLKESLMESLEAAKFCIEYQKVALKWSPNVSNEACLGYPGAILLFSIIDTIGSYFRKNKTFLIEIENHKTTIKKEGWEHFLILNSNYFENQGLSKKYIKDIYNNLRSRLTHNSITGKNALMIPRNSILSNLPTKPTAFLVVITDNNEYDVCVSLFELYQLCEVAVKAFTKDIDEVLSKSKIGRSFT